VLWDGRRGDSEVQVRQGGGESAGGGGVNGYGLLGELGTTTVWNLSGALANNQLPATSHLPLAPLVQTLALTLPRPG